MATFIRRHFWLLAGVFLLVATLVAASTLDLGVELKQAQLQSSLRVKLPDSEVAHESRWALSPREEAGAQRIPPPGPPANARAPLGEGIRAVGEHAYEIPSSEREAALARMNELALQARVVPSFRDGRAQGFKIFAIQPGSLYEKLGLQSGDVVRRINGMTLDNPEKALEVYTQLREAHLIRLELERQGQPVQKVYAVR